MLVHSQIARNHFVYERLRLPKENKDAPMAQEGFNAAEQEKANRDGAALDLSDP